MTELALWQKVGNSEDFELRIEAALDCIDKCPQYARFIKMGAKESAALLLDSRYGKWARAYAYQRLADAA